MLPKIALFDDDAHNLKHYSNFFREEFEVKSFQNPFQYKDALNEDVSAILIDVLMPVMDGVTLFKELRKDFNYNGCPVIFMSASSSEETMAIALTSGGHEYLSKGMTKDEMVLRIRNKIDHFKSNRNVFRLGNVKVLVSELKAIHGKEVIELTLTEAKIMKFLIREYPRLATREEINSEIWAAQKVMPTTLNTHLSNLRSKFPDWEYDIVNIKGKGIQVFPKE